MEDITDDDLMLMCRNGDANAFDVLFDRHYVGVFIFARIMLGSTHQADEILQETFLAVARATGRYAARGRFRSWLMRIVRNRCLNRIESERARREALGKRHGGSLDVVEAVCDQPGPAQIVQSDEQRAVIVAAVAELPDRQREAIALYAFEQMRYRQIAEVLDMPINTVKTLIHRARANLARALAPYQREQERGL